MSYEYSEDQLVEQAVEDTLLALGWKVVTAWHEETFGQNGLLGRDLKTEVVLERELRKALKKYNPGLPEKAYDRAIHEIVQREAAQSMVQQNEAKYKLFKDGVEVSFINKKGANERKKLKVFDFKHPENNDFLAVRQLEVSSDLYNRRPDVIGFVNGIPLVFMELKAHNVDMELAYTDNFTDYKDAIPHLFHFNAFVILSNGTDAKVGTITSPYQYFMEWKRITEEEEGIVSLDTLLQGVCSPRRLMDIFENFILFDHSGSGVKKLMARNHQYIGVNLVVDNVRNLKDMENKLGVFWHTQGSGKTYSMIFLCEKIHRKLGGSFTFLIVLDRTELQNQAYDTFSGVGLVNNKELIAGNRSGMTGREHLRVLLKENNRYVFTLIHKFSIDPETESVFPLITDRSNIIVISDEAHRTQGGIFARNMRFHAIPNASYLGLTGTPIIKGDEEITKNIFGEYVSTYDFERAIEDKATLPLKYLNRGEKLQIEQPDLDEKMAEILDREDLDEDQRRKLTYLFQREYPVLTAEKRLRAIAKDLVWHFNERGYQGKAMLVTIDKPTAVRMYDYMMDYWPEYLKEIEEKIAASTDESERKALEDKYKLASATEVCVVVSSEQNEVDKFRKLGLNIERHRKKMADRNLEKEFKDPDNHFRLAIVCAMWITGFDVPSVSTIYLDKPLKGHTLMQTIARANRVFDDDKETGLIVDYGNVYKQLEEAYSVYGSGSGRAGGKKKDGEKPIEELEKMSVELSRAIDEVKQQLEDLGYDLMDLVNAVPMKKIAIIKEGTNAICRNQKTRVTFEMAAREVFRKYKALFPHERARPYTNRNNAIEALYSALHQKTKAADITELINQLQNVVDDAIDLSEIAENTNHEIDLTDLNVDALRKAFGKTSRKNELVFDLNEAVEQKLEEMLRNNPLRMEFYDQYREIVDAYNRGKDESELSEAFKKLIEFTKELSREDTRAMREGLDEPTLSIFDILVREKELSKKERDEVKKVARDTLEILEEKYLNIAKWKESRELKAGIKSAIYDGLLYLPQEKYSDEEVHLKSMEVYRHVYTYNPALAM